MTKTQFAGKIQFVSVSPHGQPEGVVLEDGTWIKIPPHTVLQPEGLQVGKAIEGTAESHGEHALHHALVTAGGVALTADPDDRRQDEDLREQHKQDNKAREVQGRQATVSGRVLAIGKKPKGEIDRILLEGNVSAHVPKEVTVSTKVGDQVSVTGELREFPLGTFLKVATLL